LREVLVEIGSLEQLWQVHKQVMMERTVVMHVSMNLSWESEVGSSGMREENKRSLLYEYVDSFNFFQQKSRKI